MAERLRNKLTGRWERMDTSNVPQAHEHNVEGIETYATDLPIRAQYMGPDPSVHLLSRRYNATGQPCYDAPHVEAQPVPGHEGRIPQRYMRSAIEINGDDGEDVHREVADRLRDAARREPPEDIRHIVGGTEMSKMVHNIADSQRPAVEAVQDRE